MANLAETPPMGSDDGLSDRRSAVRMVIPCQKRPVSKKEPVVEEIETLTLSHFTKPPRIDFKTVRVGKTGVQKLRVRNPEDFEQHVEVERFPFKNNFSIDEEAFIVDPGSEVYLSLTWTPQEGGNSREMVLFKVEGVYRLQAILFGKAEEPPKPKTKKRKTWLSTSKAPTVRPRMAVQACLQGKENCPPESSKKQAPRGSHDPRANKLHRKETPPTSPQTTPTKESKRPRLLEAEECLSMASLQSAPQPSPVTHDTSRPAQRVLQFSSPSHTHSTSHGGHTPKYFPPLGEEENEECLPEKSTDRESLEDGGPLTKEDLDFPMVTATPEIIEARLPRRHQQEGKRRGTVVISQEGTHIRRDTVVLESPFTTQNSIRRDTVVLPQGTPQAIRRDTVVLSEGCSTSPDLIRRDTVVLSSESFTHPEHIHRETVVIPKKIAAPIQRPQVSPRVAQLRREYSPKQARTPPQPDLQHTETRTKVSEFLEFVDVVETEVIEEEVIVTNTVVTMETEVDGKIVNTEVISHDQSLEREVTQRIYKEEVRQHVILLQEEEEAENSITISPPKTLKKHEKKMAVRQSCITSDVTGDEGRCTPPLSRQLALADEVFSATPLQPLVAAKQMQQRGSFSSTPIVNSQALGRDSFDKMTESRPMSPVVDESFLDSLNPRRISTLTVTKSQPAVLPTPEEPLMKRNLFGITTDLNTSKDMAPLTDLSAGWQEGNNNAKNPFEKTSEEEKTSEVDSRRISNLTITKSSANQSKLPGYFEIYGIGEPEGDSMFKAPEKLPSPVLGLTYRKSPTKADTKDLTCRKSPKKVSANTETHIDDLPSVQVTENVMTGQEAIKPSETFCVPLSTDCFTPLVSKSQTPQPPKSLKRSIKSKKHRRSITHTIDEDEANASLLERPTVEEEDEEEAMKKSTTPEGLGIRLSDLTEVHVVHKRHSPAMDPLHEVKDQDIQDSQRDGKMDVHIFNKGKRDLDTHYLMESKDSQKQSLEMEYVVEYDDIQLSDLKQGFKIEKHAVHQATSDIEICQVDLNKVHNLKNLGSKLDTYPEQGMDKDDLAMGDFAIPHQVVQNLNDSLVSTMSEFQRGDLSLGDLAASTQVPQKSPQKSPESSRKSPRRRSTGKVSKITSPTKSRSPPKKVDRRRDRDRQYEKPWKAGMQSKAKKPTQHNEAEGKDTMHQVNTRPAGFTRTMELRRAASLGLNKVAKPARNPPSKPISAKPPVQKQQMKPAEAKQTAPRSVEASKPVSKPTASKARSLSQSTMLSKSEKHENRSLSQSMKPTITERSMTQSLSKSLRPGLAQSKLTLIKTKPPTSVTALPRHPLAFAAKNIYYDERWMEKEERGFICWLNFILTPPDEYFEAIKPKKVDAGALSLDRGHNTQLAPSKEMLSLRAYTARRRLNHLRSKACRLMQSDMFARVHHKLEIEIQCGRLAVRSDRMVHADLGIKQHILDMLLCYNPLWLRIGLETVYGEVLPITTNTDVYGLSRFILTRMLHNPDIAQEYSHPTVPHFYRPGYEKASSQFMLKKFLLLVLLLDHAKQQRIIKWDPCLFCKDAEYKSSRELLIVFAKDYLSGEGDVTKHLSYLGYNISYSQKALDEYEYAVSNLATDLRDGVKLTRITEQLTGNAALMQDMRVPAISRLQKIHNNEVAFKGLVEQGVQMTANRGEINPRDIVDGHREKTLQLLWKIIFNFQVNLVLSEQLLREEIKFLQQNWRLCSQLADFVNDTPGLGITRNDRESLEPELYFQDQKLQLLLQWCQAVCAYYSMKLENFTVSFCDGRALCYLVHHYHPALLPLEEIRQDTMLTHEAPRSPSIEDSLDSDSSFNGSFADYQQEIVDPKVLEALQANERINFKLLFDKVAELGGVPMMLKTSHMSNTIPDEKVVITYVSYLCCRLLDIRHETRAARVIQAAYRKHLLRKRAVHYQEKLGAVIKIQRRVRKWLKRRCEARQHHAAVTLQCWWRQHLARRHLYDLKFLHRMKVMHEAAATLQSFLRKLVHARKQKRVSAACVLQHHVRGFLARRRFLKLQQACVTLQAAGRMMLQRRRYLQLQKCLIALQIRWRHKLETRRIVHMLRVERVAQRIQRKNAALCIQKCIRKWLAKRKQERFEQQSHAATVIQRSYRKYTLNKALRMQHAAATVIQQRWQARAAMRQQRQEFLKLKHVAVILQASYRASKARRMYVTRLQAISAIQRWYRSVKLMKENRAEFIHAKTMVVTLQAHCRGWLQRKQDKKMRQAAFTIQRNFRVYRLACLVKQLVSEARMVREERERQSKAAVTIQSWYRCQSHRQRYQLLRQTAIIIQRRVKLAQHRAREELRKAAASLIIQTHWRRYSCQKTYTQQKQAAVVIQREFRRHSCNVKYRAQKLAATIIQCWYRAVRLSRAVRSEYLAKKHATVKIQAWWRGQQARREFVNKQVAVVKLQNWYRSIKLTKECESDFRTTRQAVVNIQAVWRGYLVRKDMKQQAQAATILQQQWRARCVGGQCRRQYLLQKQAAVSLQQRWRARKVGRDSRKEFVLKKTATVTLQRYWRARQASKKCRQEYLLTRQAASSLQKFWRARRLGKECRGEYVKQRNAAVTLQKHWRTKLKGKKCREYYQQLKCASVVLQRHWRARQVGRLCHSKYMNQKKAAKMIQTYWRAVFAKRRCRQEFVKLRRAAVIVQTQWRARQLAKCHQEYYQRLKNAAVSIQIIWRAKKMGRECRKSFKEKRTAAETIQRQWRARKLGRECHEEFVMLKQGAILLQQHWRARQLGRRCRMEYLQHKAAAQTIQAQWRARQLGKQNCTEFLKLKAATVVLQHYWRVKLVGKQVREDYLVKKAAALTLQRCWRATMLGRQCHIEYVQLKSAAAKVQELWRAKKLGKHCRHEYLNQKRAAVSLQKHWRSRQLGIQCHNEFKRQRQAALCLQRYWRLKQLGKQHREGFMKLKTAATTLQTYWRAREHAKLCRQKFARQKQSAITLQRYWRAKIISRKCQQDFVMQKKAAIALQRRWRARYVGKMCRLEYSKQRCAVMVIQELWRARMVGKKCQQEYVAQKQATVSIQKLWRARQAGRQCRMQYTKQRQVVIQVQAAVRGWLTRRRILQQHQACVKIQAWWRCQHAQRTFFIQKGAAMVIQEWVRVWLVRRRFLEIRDAARVIQHRWRCHRDRQQYLRLRWAATVLQQRFRSKMLTDAYVMSYHIHRGASIYIQAAVRGWLVRRQVKLQREACVKLQSVVRGWLVQRQVKLRREACVKLQSVVRGWLVRRQVKLRREACVKMQSAVRSWLVKRDYLEKRQACVKIQTTYRGYVCRRELDRRKKAVLVLQRHVRAFFAGRKQFSQYQQLRNAVVVLQAVIRGYLARNEMQKAQCLREEQHQQQTMAATHIQAIWKMHKQRTVYKQKREAATKLQSHVKRWIAQRRYVTIIRAATTIQKFTRTYLVRRQYVRLLTATSIIQEKWQATLLMRREFEKYHIQKGAAISIQAFYRMYRERRKYLTIQRCIVILQASIRRCLAVQVLQGKRQAVRCIETWYLNCKQAQASRQRSELVWKSVVVIQSAIRATLARQQFEAEKHRIQQLRTTAAVKLQAIVRGHLARRRCSELRQQVRAATCIQRHYRLYKHRQVIKVKQEQRNVYIHKVVTLTRRHLQVVRIQRCFRRHLLIKHAKQHLHSVVKIQRWMRARLQRCRYLRLVKLRAEQTAAAVIIQAAIRTYTAQRRVQRMHKSATSIQALWKGHQVRKGIQDKKVNEARKRLHEAEQAVKEEDRLGNRTSSALEFLLKYRQLAYVLKAVIDLDVSTRLSWVCCERLVACNAVSVLYTLIRSCNRSLPHMEVIKYTINILLNLSKYDKTVSYVYEVEGAMETLMELLQIYREKGVIFARTCTLLGLLCQDHGRSMEVRLKPGVVDKLLSIHKLVLRKHELEKKRRLSKAGLNIKSGPTNKHRLCPEWQARRNSVYEITDPLDAIRYVLSSLDALPSEVATKEVCWKYSRTLTPPKKMR